MRCPNELHKLTYLERRIYKKEYMIEGNDILSYGFTMKMWILLSVVAVATAANIDSVLKISQSSATSDGHIPVADRVQAPVPVHLQRLPYLKVYRNIAQVPVTPMSVKSESLVGYVPAVSVLVHPAGTPQIPFVSPIVTSAPTRAPQVPSAHLFANISAPKVTVSQNAQKVAVTPEHIPTIFPPAENIPQKTPQIAIVPEISYSNSPQIPIISYDAQVPVVPGKVHSNNPQMAGFAQNFPLIPIVPEFRYENSLNVPIFTQNSQVTVEPVDIRGNFPQEHFISQYAPSVHVDSSVNSPQVPLASGDSFQTPSVPVKVQNPVAYIPQTDSGVISVHKSPQNGLSVVDIVSPDVYKKTVLIASTVNSQHSTKDSQDSSHSSDKAFIPSQCHTIFKAMSGTNYPTIKFKHILNPPADIEEYSKMSSDELNKIRSFRCHQENEIGYVLSTELLAYVCHSDDTPVKLLVQVPKTLQSGQIIDIELDTPYSALVNGAVDGNFDGIQKASFLEDLLTPCSIGVAVLKPQGSTAGVTYLPVSVPDDLQSTPAVTLGAQPAVAPVASGSVVA